jgi:hypothetical protein
MSTNQDTLDCQAHMKVYKGVTPLWEHNNKKCPYMPINDFTRF